jgi:hypothetical protein
MDGWMDGWIICSADIAYSDDEKWPKPIILMNR